MKESANTKIALVDKHVDNVSPFPPNAQGVLSCVVLLVVD